MFDAASGTNTEPHGAALRSEQVEVLGAFARAVRRESHSLVGRPDLLWQQLHNRLQWEGDEAEVILSNEHASRAKFGSGAWMRLTTPVRESESLVRTLSHGDWVKGCAFASDGSVVLTASWGRTIKCWDVHSGSQLASISLPQFPEALAVSPDGSKVASCWTVPGTPLTGAVGIWDLRTGDLQRELRVERDLQSLSSREPGACVFTPDGAAVVAVDEGMARVWDPETGRVRGEFSPVFSLSPGACAISADGSFVVVAEKREFFWVLDGKSLSQNANFFDQALFPRKEGFWKSIKEVAAAGLMDLIYGPRDCDPEEDHIPPRGRVAACSITPDGRRAVSAHAAGALKLWDIATGELLSTVDAHPEGCKDCAVSPDGKLIASCGLDPDVKLWDACTSAPRAILTGHNDWVECCDFSPDGRNLVSGGKDGKLIIWDVEQAIPSPRTDSEHTKME
jgi:WD40 repeat protein